MLGNRRAILERGDTARLGEVDDEESIRAIHAALDHGLISSIQPMFMARVTANGCSAAQSPAAGHRL